MVSKTKQSKSMPMPMPIPLSGIFGDLPDMVKQQVLEFAQGNGPLKLSYCGKKRSFAMMVNPDFMKETLEYKLNHPPTYMRDSVLENVQVITISPPKVSKYEIWITKKIMETETRPNMVVIDSKSLKLVKAFNRKYFPKIDNKKLILGEDMYLTD
jgi:hypothetical protein